MANTCARFAAAPIVSVAREHWAACHVLDELLPPRSEVRLLLEARRETDVDEVVHRRIGQERFLVGRRLLVAVPRAGKGPSLGNAAWAEAATS